MNLSQASKHRLDPLSDVLAVLNARATRTSRLEASGEWALAFPERDRLKFVAVVKGTCWIARPGQAAERLVAGDVCLIGRTAYTVSSHEGLPPIDGAPFYDGEMREELPLKGDDTIMLGGGIAVTLDDGGFLLNMLPAFALVPRLRAGAASVAAILGLLDIEMADDRMGSDAIANRLAEVLLVEAIRACTGGSLPTGWLKGLADPHLARALALVHADIAEPWTVADLAAAVGMSRSAFAALFTRTMGQPPLDYIRTWRLVRARAMLANGERSVAEVAIHVGYTSQSAFTHAYRRVFAATPRSAWRGGDLASAVGLP